MEAVGTIPGLANQWRANRICYRSLASSLVNLPDIIRLDRLMAASAAMAAVANASLLFEPGQGGLLLARATTGIALAGVYPPALKLVSTWFANERGLALGVVIGALTLAHTLSVRYRAHWIGRSGNPRQRCARI
jgi:MFS family permease